MTHEQKIKRLENLIAEGQKQQKKLGPDAEFVVWREHVNSSLSKILGNDASQASIIRNLTFTYIRAIQIRGVDYSAADRPMREARYQRDLKVTLGIISNCLTDLGEEISEGVERPVATIDFNFTVLHPAVQSAAGSLFASAHYPQAILAACTALDKAVQAKAGLPATTIGTALMTTAFSVKTPLIKLTGDPNEQMGFMNLYQGSVQAIRNHYAHNLTEIPAARALEWLGFISALFYKLDEAITTTAS